MKKKNKTAKSNKVVTKPTPKAHKEPKKWYEIDPNMSLSDAKEMGYEG